MNTLEVVDGRTAQTVAISVPEGFVAVQVEAYVSLLAHQDLAQTLQALLASKSKTTSGELVVYGFALGLLVGSYLMWRISLA